MLSCTMQATEGKAISGETVPTIMRSISSAFTPASSNARSAALVAKSDVAWRASATRRARIPVRSTIHSSDVSNIFSKSLLVTIFSGTYEPIPKIPTDFSFIYGHLSSTFYIINNIAKWPSN
ncbi:hypothetical protein SDC9_123714 [bioreactor metagenome]|uniref:Uncharacterized protein n=1 Tax=bioreactor metagenome TaxID=1076179 RepID=A0A645CIF1_9ZZZZ